MKSKLNLKNYMEEIVFSLLDKLMEDTKSCTCYRCQADVTAYALNHLPPKYVVTQKGHVYSKLSELNQQFIVDVTVALLNAIQVVSANPRHGDSNQ